MITMTRRPSRMLTECNRCKKVQNVMPSNIPGSFWNQPGPSRKRTAPK
jgi:hypothetical protein